MTSDARYAACLSLLVLGAAASPALAAETAYPFEGTWVRANRVCVANAPRTRTYTAHEVVFATGRCAVRKVATGGNQFEIFEECRRAEHPGNFTETIRMLGPDLLQMRRQATRLKIARPLRYTRCAIAAPEAAKPAAPPAAHRGAEEHGPKAPDPKGTEAKPGEARPGEARPPEPKP